MNHDFAIFHFPQDSAIIYGFIFSIFSKEELGFSKEELGQDEPPNGPKDIVREVNVILIPEDVMRNGSAILSPQDVVREVKAICSPQDVMREGNATFSPQAVMRDGKKRRNGIISEKIGQGVLLTVEE